ncbi:hypothetical protein BU23DRAFT_432310, partial [Bimuria novae-zelandiae CBS 107.79]
ALAEWACTSEVITAKCFLWRNGSPLQRLSTGLLRSLLYSILIQRPDLIEHAFPSRDWILGMLRRALQHIIDLSEDFSLRYFFMIDGLDEVGTEDKKGSDASSQQDLVDLLESFRAKSTIKLCVSGRPSPIFTRRFCQRSNQYMAIEDLTAHDIQAYIQGELSNNEEFRQIANVDVGYQNLFDEIITTAQGVFMWVHLAVTSLLYGIMFGDRILDLQSRLRHLPQELDVLYLHIIDSIVPFH